MFQSNERKNVYRVWEYIDVRRCGRDSRGIHRNGVECQRKSRRRTSIRKPNRMLT